MSDTINEQALEYHEALPFGKLQVVPTKPMATQLDLSLAYSPGVAAPCEAIHADPSKAALYTGRGNLVAVISNGTAVLGLGNIGPLASKPVMEGKAALFKKFSGIDVFDIEVDTNDVDEFCRAIRPLEPTFGAINLEDIKAPECFAIEKRLKEEMGIPVFHDDQHGTAIVASAASLNALELVGKKIDDIKIVANGAGAASIACLELLISFGAKRENITVCDSKGVIYKDRPGRPMDETKLRFAHETTARTLDDAMDGADLFLGLSVGGAVTPEMAISMGPRPIILAMANPEPEIRPEAVAAVRGDAICATGRSDYPNQANNVLCFPFIFRGALDVGATTINQEMKMACARAIASLARAEVSDVVLSAYGADKLSFGPEYIIPKPFDPRLILEVAPAVAQAAMDSGVATRPFEDMAAYKEKLTRFVYQSGMLMKPVFETARLNPKRVVFAEGASETVLRTAQQAADAGIAKPVLIGNRDEIEKQISGLDLRLVDVEIVDPDNAFGEKFENKLIEQLTKSNSLPDSQSGEYELDTSAFAMLMVEMGEADVAICGTDGRFTHHLSHLEKLVGKSDGVRDLSTLHAAVLPSGPLFFADTNVTPDPSAEEIAEMAILAVEKVRQFGIDPKVALISNSNFGDRGNASAIKMREAFDVLTSMNPDFEFDGEMHATSALSESLRRKVRPDSKLNGRANLLIMPNIDAAHITLGVLKSAVDCISVGPIMLGAAKPVHIVSNSITVRGLLNMTALAVVDA